MADGSDVAVRQRWVAVIYQTEGGRGRGIVELGAGTAIAIAPRPLAASAVRHVTSSAPRHRDHRAPRRRAIAGDHTPRARAPARTHIIFTVYVPIHAIHSPIDRASHVACGVT